MLEIIIFTDSVSVLLALILPVPTFDMGKCFINHWHELFTHVHRTTHRPNFFA